MFNVHGQDAVALQQLLDSAEVHADASDYDGAIARYAQAKQQALQLEMPALALQAAWGYAKGWRQKGAYDQAKQLLEAAIDSFSAVLGPTHAEIGKATAQLGIVHHYATSTRVARQFYLKSLDISLQNLPAEYLESANSCSNIGLTYFVEDKIDSADMFLSQSIEYFRAGNLMKHPFIVNAYNLLGVIHEERTDHKQALAYYDTAMTIARLHPKKTRFALPDVYTNMGVIAQRLEDYGQAILLFEQALVLYNELFTHGHPAIAITQNNLSVSYQNKGDFDKAQQLIAQAIENITALKGPLHPDIGFCYNNLGLLYSKQGMIKKGFEAFKKGLKIYREADGPLSPKIALLLTNIGRAYGKMGNHQKAVASFEESLAIRQEILGPYSPRVADTYLEWGAYYRENGQYKEALVQFERSEAVCLSGKELTP